MSKLKQFLSGGAKKNQSAVAAAKWEFTRGLLLTGFVVVLACFAGFSYISKAWFASNKDVGAENASVTSESGTPNLFIRMQADKDETTPQYFSYIKKDWSGATPLFPISTADCAKWFYISDWAMVYSEKADGITTGEYYASRYAPATPDADGIYTGYAGKTHRAYYCGQYNLYSDKGELNVYLNPTDPIVVNLGKETDTPEQAAVNQGLKNAIRVAVVGPETKFIYAPVAESGTGKNYIDYNNGTMAVADTFYAVTGTNTAAVQTVLVGDAGLADYKGGVVDGDPHSFTAGKNKICTATTAGANVSVYVWLEGMDAQSIINTADGRTIDVKLNFVGVPVAAAATP